MSVKACFSIIPGILRHTKLLNTHYLQSTSLISIKTSQIANASTRTKVYLPSDVKEVYYGILTPQIMAVKFFSLSSSIVGLIGQPFLYEAILTKTSIPLSIAVYSFIGFFTVVTPILLNFITKKYVTYLLYRPSTDTYLATTVNFFCISKQTEFKPSEVVVPEVPGMFTSFVVKGKPMFLDPKQFDRPEHYARIMGYDKPIDFKLKKKALKKKSI